MVCPVQVGLALAVADAGGHAVYPAVQVPRRRLEMEIARLRARTAAFGVTFVIPLIDPAIIPPYSVEWPGWGVAPPGSSRTGR